MTGFQRLFRPCRHLTVMVVIAIAGYVAALGYGSLEHSRRFSSDSANYVDVARNLNSGRGLVQSTLGFNQYAIGPTDLPPTPYVAQAPLYPMLVAGVARLGLEEADAALILPVIGFAAVILLLYLLAANLAGPTAGWLAVVLGLLVVPLAGVARWAWSETLGLALVLACCWFLLGERRGAWPLIAGLAAGLAVATRYALAPVFLLGPVQFLGERVPIRDRIVPLLKFGMGALVAPGAMAWHNWQAAGGLTPSRAPSTKQFGEVFESTWRGMLRLHLDLFSGDVERFLLVVPLVVVAVVLGRSGKLRRATVELGWRGRALIVWILAYPMFLVWQRSTYHFDDIGDRLLMPATTVVLILWAAWVQAPRRWSLRWMQAAVVVVAIVLTVGAVRPIIRGDAPPNWRHPAQSARLDWLEKNVGPEDLIIGNDASLVAFYLEHPAVVTFEPWPYSSYASAEFVNDLAARWALDFGRTLLAVVKEPATEAEQMRRRGAYFTDLMQGRSVAYPQLVVLQDSPEFVVFEVVTPEGYGPTTSTGRQLPAIACCRAR